MNRASLLIVAALTLAGICVWLFARLLAQNAQPLWFLLPGFGFAAAWIVAQAGLRARRR